MALDMHKKFVLIAGLAVVLAAERLHAQLPTSGTLNQTTGQIAPMGQSTPGQTSGGFQNPDDAISAIAPPFEVEDVLRMHRVGLTDEVIINALRARYHPLVLTDQDRDTLKKAGVSDRVMVAMEDPYGVGIENVRRSMMNSDAASPPFAQTTAEARLADPNTPKLKVRPVPNGSDPGPENGAVPRPGSDLRAQQPAADSVARLDLSRSPVTAIPPAPIMKTVAKPVDPGIYLRRGPDWERMDGEPVYWRHHGEKDIEGSVLRPGSTTQTYPGGTDFLIITQEQTAAMEYQLLKLDKKDDKRTFRPAPPHGVYTAGGGSLEPFTPQNLGPHCWLVSLHNLPPGEYGFLPPVTEQVHSTTGLANAIFTFRIP